jgi:DNA invertase Pin-like site-specific DNA recombinase
MVVKKARTKAVIYYRVSTQEQGRSGLGLEAQRTAAQAFCQLRGLTICREFTEVETGKKFKLSNRPQLQAALDHARSCHCVLVIAKLDRLARNAAFVCTLLESNLPILAVDMPEADRTFLQIMAVIAEREAKMISDRTKAALAAYKARGGKLGAHLPQCQNLTQEAREKGAIAAGKTVHEKAIERYQHLFPGLLEMRAHGKTYKEIAEELNAEGHETARGNPWSIMQVKNVLQMALEHGAE